MHTRTFICPTYDLWTRHSLTFLLSLFWSKQHPSLAPSSSIPRSTTNSNSIPFVCGKIKAAYNIICNTVQSSHLNKSSPVQSITRQYNTVPHESNGHTGIKNQDSLEECLFVIEDRNRMQCNRAQPSPTQYSTVLPAMSRRLLCSVFWVSESSIRFEWSPWIRIHGQCTARPYNETISPPVQLQLQLQLQCNCFPLHWSWIQ